MNLKWILRHLLCAGFKLSNDDIISVICKHLRLRLVTTSRSPGPPPPPPPPGIKRKILQSLTFQNFKCIVRHLMHRSSTFSSSLLCY